jgi:ribonuclease P protein component
MSLLTLQKPWQFRQVYRGGKKIDCKYAVLFYYRTGEPAQGPHFGFVASKKLGNAVRRNRAKRLLREVAGQTVGRLKHRDLWIVLVARSEIIRIKRQDLLADIGQNLEDEGLLSPGVSS